MTRPGCRRVSSSANVGSPVYFLRGCAKVKSFSAGAELNPLACSTVLLSTISRSVVCDLTAVLLSDGILFTREFGLFFSSIDLIRESKNYHSC
jgi:hypothetical protein